MTRAAPTGTMDDWLTLHGLSPVLWRALLDRGESRPARRPAPTPVALDAAAAWAAVGDAVARGAPVLAPLVRRTRDVTRAVLGPDPDRYPRALTVPDDGHGAPVVLCPWAGEARDLLVMAHELGHAMNYLASERDDSPPVLRETCAILCETLAVRGLPDRLAEAVAPIVAERRARQVGPLARALRDALADPGAAYVYDWNYPPARILADALAGMGDDRLPALYASGTTVADLVREVARPASGA